MTHLLSLTRDADFWRKRWLEAKMRSPANRRFRGSRSEEIALWDRRASSYAEHTAGERSRQDRESLLGWLSGAGALSAEARVLDIGAGPGNFALAMAARVREVVALEPSEGMLAILRRRLAEQGCANVRAVAAAWEDFDLEEELRAGPFDLVFASMSPGVSDPAALARMVRASGRFCFWSGWSGGLWGRWGRAQAELWPRLFGEELGEYPSDALYPFGLLYAQGFRPDLRFRGREMRIEEDAEEVVAALSEHLSRYAVITPSIRSLIEDHVAAYSRQGLFRQSFTAWQAFMLWRVEGPSPLERREPGAATGGPA